MPNHFSFDPVAFCSPQRSERCRAIVFLELAPERRRFGIIVVRPFPSIPEQAGAPRSFPRPSLQDPQEQQAEIDEARRTRSFVLGADLKPPPSPSSILPSLVSH
jgi:hypothetical protein